MTHQNSYLGPTFLIMFPYLVSSASFFLKAAFLEITRQGNHKQFAILSVIDFESI